MLRGYLILIRFVAVIVIFILASLFLEHTVVKVIFVATLFLYVFLPLWSMKVIKTESYVSLS